MTAVYAFERTPTISLVAWPLHATFPTGQRHRAAPFAKALVLLATGQYESQRKYDSPGVIQPHGGNPRSVGMWRGGNPDMTGAQAQIREW